MTLRLISNTRASEPGTITSLTASLGTLTYRVSPGLALGGVEGDSLHSSLGPHSAENVLRVRG